MKKYKELTYSKRNKIFKDLKKNLTIKEIAKLNDISTATVNTIISKKIKYAKLS
jgi:DNA-binding NarL/FixJ family response regulator